MDPRTPPDRPLTLRRWLEIELEIELCTQLETWGAKFLSSGFSVQESEAMMALAASEAAKQVWSIILTLRNYPSNDR